MTLTEVRDDEVYGAFRHGPMALALPMASLREVVPYVNLQPFPTGARWMLGGLNLRDVLIPVIDLCQLLGQPKNPDDQQCVVIVTHKGRLTGIVATEVDCLFNATAQQVNLFHSNDPVGRVARGSLYNPVSGRLLSVLCVESLMALPELTAVNDPEPMRQNDYSGPQHAAGEEHAKTPLLLMRSKGLLFAVNPENIETTMPRARLESKDVCSAYYKGNAIYREREIPAISLTEYLEIAAAGVQAKASENKVQPAFVLQFEQSAMAVLIDEILDIVKVDPAHLMDLPQVPALKNHILHQIIAEQSIYPDKPSDEHYYVIHPQAMVADQRLKQLADLVHQAEGSKTAATQVVQARGKVPNKQGDQRVIIFDMDGDHAIALGEISEVLPYRGVKEAFSRNNPFRGVMTHRNRAIPVIDLAQQMGLSRQQLDSSCNILVVHVDGKPAGLAVGCLRSIEQAHWAPEVPVLGAARNMLSGLPRHTQKLVEVLIGKERRLLEVISALDEATRFLTNTQPQSSTFALEPAALQNKTDQTAQA